MRRVFHNKFMIGIFLFMLFAGVFFCFGNVRAAVLAEMNPGQSRTMKLPLGWKNARWSSSKKTVATVNARGTVKGVAPGKAVITAKSTKGIKKYTVKVQKVQLSSSNITMKKGETRIITVKNAFGKVIWLSDSEAVRVDSEGKITAVEAGKAVVTASVFGKKYHCMVTVEDGKQEEETETYKMQIIVGNQKFSAVLYDNDTVRALIKKLPMTVTMNELNGNEKYYYFSERLPSDSGKPKKIHTGDIMLYGPDCLVLFYDDFSTSYSYTPVGSISSPKGLAEALGSGNVRVTFSLE